ncbi:outer membrane beta-barrel protein [Sphingobacterium sp. FBM7-1]|uniref:outer membrane beta-barrel protein n=1 Tax=Sphingobacterium sp. FBM7-1 TaxID=2886688 RepID=UPI001D12EA76|nr:TonB-dependent receptor [Sphingobacterium sp. FBM7-1]MCC2597971.1 TonB-dependent receptor family protein [Sphingobacterium sp. FBM7-1]
MRQYRYLIFLIGALFFVGLEANVVQAQTEKRQIQGFVVDTVGTRLKGVTVRLTSTEDTIMAISSNAGYYRFKDIRGSDIRISYSMIGYQIVSRVLSPQDLSSFIVMPNVILRPQNSLIEGVYVVKTIPMVYMGDTIQYNMDAFTFRSNSLLEEALKQLPGIQVSRDGTVYAQGKPISSVQVDGKRFFGGDVLTATRNLPADFIKSIQVLNYRNEHSTDKSFTPEEPQKVLNIVLKEDRKRISFGQLTAGVGTRERYIGSAGLNRFDDGQEFSVVGSINNTNTSLFSFGSPTGMGERETSLFDATDFVDPTDGLNNIKSLGVSFSDNLAENTQFNASYTFSRKKNFTEGNSILRSDYLLNRISNEENYDITNDNNFHRLAAEFKHLFKNQDVLEIKPIFSYSSVHLWNNRRRQVNNNRITNRGTYQDSSYQKNPNLDLDLLYVKAFKKPGRKLLGNVSFNFNSQRKLEDVLDRYVSLDSTPLEPLRSLFEQRYFIQLRNGTDAVRASMSFVEPFSDYSTLELLYHYELTDMTTQRLVEDKLKSEELGDFVYVDSLGVNYNYRFRNSRMGLNYQYTPNKSFKTNIGFAVQPVRLSSFLPKEDMEYTYENVNLVPTAGFKWRLNEETDWSVDYIGKNNQPNLLHIIPIRDNSNSQNIIVGNPELKAEFSNRISTTLRKFVTSRGQYLETNFAYNYVSNKIVSDKTAFSGSTIQETTFKNTDGYYDIRWYYLFNTPLFSENVQLDISGNTDYYHNLSYVNDQRNTTQQFLYSQSAQLRYSWGEYVESVFKANYLLNQASYTWPYPTKITGHSLLASAAAKSYLGEYVTVGAEMSQRFNSGYASSFMNINPTIINAYLEFSFLHNKRALLRLQGFDLLDQNKNMGTYSEYVGNDLYEARNNRLGRYFMITLNLRLQKFPKDR